MYPSLLWFRVEWCLVSRIVKQNVLLCKNHWALKNQESLWNTAYRRRKHLWWALAIRQSLRASVVMVFMFYYFLLLKCFLLKQMIKAKLYCLSHLFFKVISSNSIKKKEAIELENTWCFMLRSVWDMFSWKHGIKIYVYGCINFVDF